MSSPALDASRSAQSADAAAVAALLPAPEAAVAAVAAGDAGALAAYVVSWERAAAAAKELADRLGVPVPEITWVVAAAVVSAAAVGELGLPGVAAVAAVAPGALLAAATRAPGLSPAVPGEAWRAHFGDVVAPAAADHGIATAVAAIAAGAAGWFRSARSHAGVRAPPALINKQKLIVGASSEVICELAAWGALRPHHLVALLRLRARYKSLTPAFSERLSVVFRALYGIGWTPATLLQEALTSRVSPVVGSPLRIFIMGEIMKSLESVPAADVDIDWATLVASAHSAGEAALLADWAGQPALAEATSETLQLAVRLRAPYPRLVEIASAMDPRDAITGAATGGNLELVKNIFFGQFHCPRWYFRESDIAALYAATPREHYSIRDWLIARLLKKDMRPSFHKWLETETQL